MVIHQDAKTKVWGCSNQYDIQINLRRMEQFVLINLCCHLWLRAGVTGEMPTCVLCWEKIDTATSRPHRCAYSSAMPSASPDTKKWQRCSSNVARGKCHEMLKSSLRSRHWPRRSPAWMVRQAALLFKGMPRHLRGQATENVATRMERRDLRRVALLATD
jgi:hypothetical protein